MKLYTSVKSGKTASEMRTKDHLGAIKKIIHQAIKCTCNKYVLLNSIRTEARKSPLKERLQQVEKKIPKISKGYKFTQ